MRRLGIVIAEVTVAAMTAAVVGALAARAFVWLV